MSLDALITGRLCGKPLSRAAKTGINTFVTPKVRAVQANAENAFVNVIAFSETVKSALLALDYGDTVAIAGELKVSVYTDKEGIAKPSLDLTAHALLTEYHVQRKRRAVTAEPEEALQ